MFSLMLQKLLHKKWMVICLLIGNILLIAVSVSHPLYRSSSFQRMLTDEFDAYYEKSSRWPATFSVVYRKSAKSEGLLWDELEQYVSDCDAQFGVPLKYKEKLVYGGEFDVKLKIPRDEQVSRSLRFAAMTGIEDHIEITQGRLPSSEPTDDGYIEVMVSEGAVASQDYLLGEEATLEKCFDPSETKEYKIRIVGFYKAINARDVYWGIAPGSFTRYAFIPMETYEALFAKDAECEKYYSCTYNYYSIWDYSKIKPEDVGHLVKATDEVSNVKTFGRFVQKNYYEDILESYSLKAKKVEASLLILQVPALLLLCAFLYMISGQMLAMEQSEIALMKSRGAKRGQILALYFLQALFLGVISLIIGMPLGALMCSVLGTASDFLEFSVRRALEIKYTTDVLIYAGGALLAGIVMSVVPVIKMSKLTIVHAKQGKHKGKRSIWKIAFLDVIFLGISLYGFYSFKRTENSVIQSVLSGESLDPLLYFSSSLFILGASFLLLRIQPWIVKLIYKIRSKRLSPAKYASFLESIRSGKKQEFIMIFLMLTVALGIYNAIVARTIVSNAENNASYVAGAPFIIRERWLDNSSQMEHNPNVEFKYTEPDYGKYQIIDGVKDTAKVVNRPYSIRVGGRTQSFQLLGITPSDFAKVTSLDSSLLPYDYYDYLNVLASVPNGCFVSENAMLQGNLHIGSTIAFKDDHFGDISLKVYGFFPYWPTYEPKSYSLNVDGTIRETENIMVVCNISYLESEWAVTPYEIWMTTTDDGEGIYQYIEDHPKMEIVKLKDINVTKEDIRSDTLFQGTNGILTMSFVIVLLLCAVGYLIYWIMSIRSRELLFGILRAMGMRKTEITEMLVMEQIFCGLYSIVSGSVIGFVASKMYVPLVQSAYAADNQVLPLSLTVSTMDMTKLFVTIMLVMIVCLVVIARIVSHMNISNALKLGED